MHEYDYVKHKGLPYCTQTSMLSTVRQSLIIIFIVYSESIVRVWIVSTRICKLNVVFN